MSAMIKNAYRFFILILAVIVIPVFAAKSPTPPPFVSDQVLVAFKPGTPAAEVSAAHNRVNGQVLRMISAIGVQVVSVPAGTVLEKIQLYRRNPNIRYAEPNYLRPLIMPIEGSFGGGIDVFDEQWSLHNQGTALQTYVDASTGLPGWQFTRSDADIDAPEAWDIDKGDANIWVAVPDSGIDCLHPDLAGKCIHEEDHVTPTTDSFGTPIPELTDQLGHGTHVAGIIAMHTNNGAGGAGVGWNTSIGSFKVCYMESIVGITVGSSCQDADIASAVTRAADLGYHVINMSFGQTAPSQVVKDALDYASGNGVLLIAAAGNNNNWENFYPAAYGNVVSVGATNAFDDRASFSSFSVEEDDWVDVLAPGEPILSTVPGAFFCASNPQCFQWKMGTSMAAPHVSGVAALVWSYLNANDPVNANSGEVRRRIQDCTDTVGVMGQDMLVWSRYGRLNAAAALNCGNSPPLPSPPITFDAFEQAGASLTIHPDPLQVGEYQFAGVGGTPATFQQEHSLYARTNSASLTVTNDGDLVLSRIDNAEFDLLSVDLDGAYGGAPTFEFIGQLAGGETVEQNFTADDLFGNQTLNLSGFLGVSAVTMSAPGSQGFGSIGSLDNVVVRPSPIDTDMDGVPDFIEDSNGNGVVDAGETDPSNPDSDGDGLNDGDEDANSNGIVDAGETNPLSTDSDNDGLSDGYEVNIIASDPTSPTTVYVTLGDMNVDGDVNVGDLILLQQEILNP